MNISQFKESLPLFLAARITPLVVGHKGVGKSQVVKDFCKEKGYYYSDFRLGQMSDAGDLIGLPDIVKDSKGKVQFSKFALPERFIDVIEFAKENPDKYAVIFFDEINRGSKDLVQAIFQIVLDGELNGVKFPENVRCIAAMNPQTDEYDVLDIDDAAFSDRFCQIQLQPSEKEWIKYAKSKEFDSSLVSFIQDQPQFLYPKMSDFTLKVTPSGRSFEKVNNVLKLNETIKVKKSTLKHVLIGIIGLEATLAYTTFLNDFNVSIKGLEVLNDFPKVRHLVEKHSKVDNSRIDIINNINDELVSEIEKLKSLNVNQERNLVDYIKTIPKDNALGLLKSRLISLEAVLNTESCSEYGLLGNPSKPTKSSKIAKELIDYIDNYVTEIRKTEDKGASNE